MSRWPLPISPLQRPFPSITNTLVVSCVFFSLAEGSFAIVFYSIYLPVSFFHEGGREFYMGMDLWKRRNCPGLFTSLRAQRLVWSYVVAKLGALLVVKEFRGI